MKDLGLVIRNLSVSEMIEVLEDLSYGLRSAVFGNNEEITETELDVLRRISLDLLATSKLERENAWFGEE